MAEYNITAYGAQPGGKNCASAVQRAIDAAAAAGGGRVVVPQGDYLCGSVRLKSHVTLHLEAGAVLRSSLDPAQIEPFRTAAGNDEVDGWAGGFFVGAQGARDVVITGPGVIDGQGDKVFFDANEDNGFHECPKACADFRPRMLLFEDVADLTIRDVTLRNAAFWTLHLAGCRRVHIEGIYIDNDDRGGNNDGIDPDSCQDVTIRNCFIHTGDDAVVVKSTAPMARRYGPSENILITGCVLHSRDSALKIGTETHGVIRNIILSDCVVKDCSRAVGIWVRDGGTVENVQVHHITGAVRRYADRYAVPGAPGWWGKGEPVFISATRRPGKENFPGVIRNISFDHLTLTAESGLFLGGEADCPIKNVRISDLDLTLAKQGTQPGGLFDEQPSARGVYAHTIPALYARSVQRLILRHAVLHDGGGTAWNGQLTQLEDCRCADIQWENAAENT